MASYSGQSSSTTTNPSGGILGGATAGTAGSQQRGMWTSQQPSTEQGALSSLWSSARDWLQFSIGNSSEFMRRYVNQYPLLAGYLFTLMTFSAIPVSVYATFGLVSSFVLLSIALVGFAAVEGVILLASGGLLLTVLGTIAFFTSLGFGFLGVTWLGYRSFKAVFGRVWEGAGYVSSTVGQKIQEAMPPMQGTQSSQFGTGAAR